MFWISLTYITFPVCTAIAFDLIFRKLLLHIGCLLSHFNIANYFHTNTKAIHQYEFDEDGNVSESFTIKTKTASLYQLFSGISFL